VQSVSKLVITLATLALAPQAEIKRKLLQYLASGLPSALCDFLEPQGVPVRLHLTYLPESDEIAVVYDIPVPPSPRHSIDDAWVEQHLFYWKVKYRLVLREERCALIQASTIRCSFIVANEGVFATARRRKPTRLVSARPHKPRRPAPLQNVKIT